MGGKRRTSEERARVLAQAEAGFRSRSCAASAASRRLRSTSGGGSSGLTPVDSIDSAWPLRTRRTRVTPGACDRFSTNVIVSFDRSGVEFQECLEGGRRILVSKQFAAAASYLLAGPQGIPAHHVAVVSLSPGSILVLYAAAIRRVSKRTS